MEIWIISDSMSEYLEYHNCTNNIMVFGKDRSKALKTNSSEHAFVLARIARELYGRKLMRMQLA